MTLWVVGVKLGEWHMAYYEDCKQEIFEFAILATYFKELWMMLVREQVQCLYWQAK